MASYKSQVELAAALAAAEARIAELEAAKAVKLTVKVNPTGTVSVFGGRGRFPLASLYANEWEQVFALVPTIKAALPEAAKVAATPAAEAAREAARKSRA